MAWLSCKGEWEACALELRVSKKNFSDQEDLFEFLLKPDLLKQLGDPKLVEDLVDRHIEAEKKLPSKSKGKFIKSNLSSITTRYFIANFLAYSFRLYVLLLNQLMNIPSQSLFQSSRIHFQTVAPRNPDFPLREDLWRYKCWVGAKEKRKQRHQSEVSLSRTATVEEESFYDTLSLGQN